MQLGSHFQPTGRLVRATGQISILPQGSQRDFSAVTGFQGRDRQIEQNAPPIGRVVTVPDKSLLFKGVF